MIKKFRYPIAASLIIGIITILLLVSNCGFFNVYALTDDTYDKSESVISVAKGYFEVVDVANRLEQDGDRLLHTYFEDGSHGENTFVGLLSGNYTLNTGGQGGGLASHNTGLGYSTLSALTTGWGNTAVGRRALATVTTGYQNTAIGAGSLIRNTTGFGNTAVGYGVLATNTVGTRNIGMAAGALQRNTTGSSNIAIGTSSMNKNITGHQNTAVGVGTLLRNRTGYKNIAMGVDALYWNATGNQNVALGFGAGGDAYNPTNASITDSNMVFIGYFAGRSVVSEKSLTNAIAIGANALVGTSNTVVIGNDNITDTYLKGTITLNGDLILTSGKFKTEVRKVDYNDWATLEDVIQALVDLGLFDQP